MCEYCEKGRAISKDNVRRLGIELHSAKKKLVIYGIDEQGWDISLECKINYCPMCGKRIGVENENNN